VVRRTKIPKTDFLFARVTPAERELLQRAADVEFLSISSWARQTLLKAATEVLGEPPLPSGDGGADTQDPH
jgi:uncharacterized protein (DUF1778 family)